MHNSWNHQQHPDKLTYVKIDAYMKKQFDPTCYIIRERHSFWTDIQRKPGETPRELAARIRQKVSKCDFQSITNPLEEVLCFRFISAINYQAVLKLIFQEDTTLTFEWAAEKATKIKGASKAAKAQVLELPDTVKSINKKHHNQMCTDKSNDNNIVISILMTILRATLNQISVYHVVLQITSKLIANLETLTVTSARKMII